MKNRTNYLKSFAALTLAFLFISVAVFADGETTEVYLSGSTNTAAGDFVVTGTDDVYHFQGQEFNVYNVYYDDPSHNMKIAVANEENCKSYIAYANGYWFMYNCTKDGFGVRKSMFKSANIRDGFDAREFHDQTILVKDRKIEKDQAVGLIASYLPKLQS